MKRVCACPGVVTIVNPDGGKVSLNFTSVSLRSGLDNMELYNSDSVDTEKKFWQAVPDPVDSAVVVAANGGLRRLSAAVSSEPTVVSSGEAAIPPPRAFRWETAQQLGPRPECLLLFSCTMIRPFGCCETHQMTQLEAW
jgi:hypothetical protein